MTGFVYRWTNKLNGRWYVGSHEGDPGDGYIASGRTFLSAVKRYGIENFSREILYIGTEFRKVEEAYLQQLNAANSRDSYNLKNTAFGGRQTHPLVIEKMTQVGAKNGMYGKKGQNSPLFGRKQSEEHKRKRLQGLHVSVTCLNDGRNFASVKDAAEFYGVCRCSISRICRGLQTETYGLKFSYTGRE